MRSAFRILVTWFVLSTAFGVLCPADTTDGRPSILDLDRSRRPGLVDKIVADYSTSIEFIEQMVEALIPRLADYEIFLLSRDSDTLYDGILAALVHHPNGRKLIPKVHRVIFSRHLAAKPSATLTHWLTHSGLSFERLARQEQKAILIDIGWAGTQPTQIIDAMIAQLRGRPSYPALVAELIANLDVRLMGGTGRVDYDKMREELNVSSLTDSQVNEIIKENRVSKVGGRPSFGFRNILEDLDREEAYNRAADLQNDVSNWGPTPTGFADGLELKFSTSADNSISENHVIAWQHALWERFLLPEVRSRIDEEINKIISPPAAIFNPVPSSLKVPVEYQGFSVDYLGSLGKASALVVKERTGKRLFRVVIPNDPSPEAAADVQAQVRRLRRLTDQGLPALVPDLASPDKQRFLLPDGISGKEWLATWIADGKPQTPDLNALVDLVCKMVQIGTYARNLTPENLWLSNGRWYIAGTAGFDQPGPALAAYYLTNSFHQRWEPAIAQRFQTMLLDQEIPKLDALPFRQLPAPKQVYLLADGTPIIVRDVLNEKKHMMIYKVDLPGGRHGVLKWPITEPFPNYLQQQVAHRLELIQRGVSAAEVVAQSNRYTIYQRRRGPNGNEWLADYSHSTDSEKQLGELFRTLSDKGIFVSGLWPSHVVYHGDKWEIVGHHGVVTARKPEPTLDGYKQRFKDRWLPKVDPSCASKIYQQVFGETP